MALPTRMGDAPGARRCARTVAQETALPVRTHSPRRRRALPALAALACAVAAPAVAAAAPASHVMLPAPLPEGIAPPTDTLAWTGRLVTPVTARRAPSAGAGRVMALSPQAPLGGGETRLLVTGVDTSGAQPWVQVLLPRRPNGTRGWVPAAVLAYTATPYRIVIDQSDRRLTLLRAGIRVLSAPAAIGAAATPTPNGHFAVAETIRTNAPSGFTGPWVLPITGFSEVLNEFDGGDGRAAIHGTSLPSLLGTRASHGCVRISNAAVVRLARVVTGGVPVDIQA